METLTSAGELAAVSGIGVFTLAVLRLAYGAMRDRTADLKDRIDTLEGEVARWQARALDEE